MTVDEINFAMNNREKVILARGSIALQKPLAISGIAKMIRSKHDVERGKEKYYVNVILLDDSGSVINASPNQLDAADPEKLAAMMAWFAEVQARKVVDPDGEHITAHPQGVPLL